MQSLFKQSQEETIDHKEKRPKIDQYTGSQSSNSASTHTENLKDSERKETRYLRLSVLNE